MAPFVAQFAVRLIAAFAGDCLPQGLKPLCIANLDGAVETVPLQPSACRDGARRSTNRPLQRKNASPMATATKLSATRLGGVARAQQAAPLRI